jgi:hypothetical protein
MINPRHQQPVRDGGDGLTPGLEIRVPELTARRSSWVLAFASVAAIVACGSGCKQTPRVVPVAGKVLYNGKPLPFGSVMFQPDQGQAAVGDIQADGSFKLSSYGPDDGAVPGTHKVSVSCYEGHRPGKASGDSLGKLLIPLKYTRFGSSGLTAEVQDTAGKDPQEIVLELSGPAVTFN